MPFPNSHDDEIITDITYGRAASAVAANVLQSLGLPHNSTIFQNNHQFNLLVSECDFLTEAMESGVPPQPHDETEKVIDSIVRFVNADLYNEQLAKLTQAVASIATNQHSTGDRVIDILEKIRIAADSIDSAEPDEERSQINEHARTNISHAVEELQSVAVLLDSIRQENARIDSEREPVEREAVNQETRGLILANLEKLAFNLGKDKWAASHNFQNPDRI